MNDNDLIKALRPAMLAGLALLNVDASVKQNFQPTAVGMDEGPALYFTKLFDALYGWPQRTETFDAGLYDGDGGFVHRETQLIESTFQMTAVLRQTPGDTDGLTASDLAKTAAAILRHDTALTALAQSGLSVLRIGQVRNLQIVSGEGQNEAIPSFDFVLKHADVIETTTPAAVVKDFRVKSI